MSELVQSYVPDWYADRLNEIKATEIILSAFNIINPLPAETDDPHPWSKQGEMFKKSKEYRDVYAYVSDCCKDTVDYDGATSIFEDVYDAVKPDGNKAEFMQENAEKIAEFIDSVMSRCNEDVTIAEALKSPVFDHEVKYDNVSASAPQALAIKYHLECINLTLSALDLTDKLLPEQICVVKDHLKYIEVLLGDLVTSRFPMLF